MMKKVIFLSLILGLVFLNYGFCEPVKLRIISLAPATTEILFALGLDKEIVGVSQFCNYPPQALAKEKVGTFSDPDMEKILSLKPDLIVCTGLKQAAVVIKLKQLGLNVCVSDPADFNALFASIHEIGGRVGKAYEAQELISRMRGDINQIKAKVNRIKRSAPLRVYVEIWHGPLLTAGRNSFINEILNTAGAVNIAGDVKKAYFNISDEAVIHKNPQVIIAAYMDNSNAQARFARRPGWGNLDAVKSSRVYNDFNADILLRPGPRLAQGLNEIYNRLYENN